jgi:hypothetical protein
MRYLWPTLSLIVAVALIQDYVLTIVVSALSGGNQLLSILGLYGKNWLYHFGLGALLAAATCYLTIRGRGEAARVVFGLITVFGLLTVTMGIGLLLSHLGGVPPVPAEAAPQEVSLGQAMLHMLTASMRGMVALTGLEAVSIGTQFMKDEDAGIVRWGRRRFPRLRPRWDFYRGKSGIGRFVQTSFLFYGGLTTPFLTLFPIRFDVFDGTFGRTLVGNLAFIGFGQLPGGCCSGPTRSCAEVDRRLDDRPAGCSGDRVARRGHRRDPGGDCLSRPAGHLHPPGHHPFRGDGADHAAGARPPRRW